MMPRALATLTMLLLKPDSCQAIAVASEPGTPCWAAIEPICAADRRPPAGAVLVATGDAAGPAAVPGTAAGMRRRVPAMMCASDARPLAAASAAGVMPLASATPISVSPGLTRCPPPLALPVGAGADAGALLATGAEPGEGS